DAATSTTIQDNLIAGNAFEGILLTQGAATTDIHGNVIAGNKDTGIDIEGATGTIVQGNLIGTDFTGATLGNAGEGIYVQNASATIGGTAVGAGNTIAFNAGGGVVVHTSATGVAIRGNSIFNNTGLGIDLQPAGVTANDPGCRDLGAK